MILPLTIIDTKLTERIRHGKTESESDRKRYREGKRGLKRDITREVGYEKMVKA